MQIVNNWFLWLKIDDNDNNCIWAKIQSKGFEYEYQGDYFFSVFSVVGTATGSKGFG